jgi:hypothetical protein
MTDLCSFVIAYLAVEQICSDTQLDKNCDQHVTEEFGMGFGFWVFLFVLFRSFAHF